MMQVTDTNQKTHKPQPGWRFSNKTKKNSLAKKLRSFEALNNNFPKGVQSRDLSTLFAGECIKILCLSWQRCERRSGLTVSALVPGARAVWV